MNSLFNENKEFKPNINTTPLSGEHKKKSFFKMLLLFFASFGIILGLIFFLFVFKASSTFSIVSQQITSFLGISAAKFPVADPAERNRLDILILGIRGDGDPHGGRLTDTIILASINTKTYETALISIPRDTYLKFPIVNISAKINEAYEVGEQKQRNGGGIALAKLAVSEVTGINIDYAVVIDFTAFKETVDLMGGIDVHVTKPFSENLQWGGMSFSFEPGIHHMDGDTALLYARSRFSTSDFDRARRQQEIILAIREKAGSMGLLSNPQKAFKLLDILGRNVKTDLTVSEITKLFSVIQKIEDSKPALKVLDTSGGLLMSTYTSEGAYILLPTKGDFSDIHNFARNIFTE